MIIESIEICEGNPGAVTFLVDACKINSTEAEKSFLRMKNNNITGDKLYMLWNDCCDRDTKKAMHIMKYHTIKDILKHINYENGRGIKYTEEEISLKPLSKEFLLDDGNHSIYTSSRYKPYGGYVVIDIKNIKTIEEAEDILLQQCLSVIKDILRENKETFLHVKKDESHPNCLIGYWELLLPTGGENND